MPRQEPPPIQGHGLRPWHGSLLYPRRREPFLSLYSGGFRKAIEVTSTSLTLGEHRGADHGIVGLVCDGAGRSGAIQPMLGVIQNSWHSKVRQPSPEMAAPAFEPPASGRMNPGDSRRV